MKNTRIPKRNDLFLSLSLILGAILAPTAYADDYPIFYDTENPAYGNVAVPEINFPAEPPVCAADDQKCIDTYMNTLGEHLQGNINAQMTPSPVYSWEAGKCALNDIEQCNKMETQWHAWQDRAQNASLDFIQGPDQKNLVCQDVYDWWGMRYVYKCQDETK